jgi:hypothetical protein
VTPRLERFTAAPILRQLTSFQQATVEHVADRLYGPGCARRFLVADETGLGKSLVARGVIARAIEHLQDDPCVGRIDVVYVCSNADIAKQNIRRLDVTGEPHLPFASRLTLLAKHSARLAGADGRRFRKPVNLVSFTPGTSFEMGWHTGWAEERALLYLLLRDTLDLSGWPATAARRLLQGNVRSLGRFEATIRRLEAELAGDIDPVVVTSFQKAVLDSDSLSQFEELVDGLGQRQSVPHDLRDGVRVLTGTLRSELARVSVHTLEPDLIILDEFQRFRHLLDREHGGDAADLAHYLFDYPDARVLLLSATPYKPFTYAEESSTGEDHQRDFLQTLRFLAEGCDDVSVDAVADDLAAYRQATVSGADATDLARALRHQLLRVMSRTERPQLGDDQMLVERRSVATDVTTADLLGYAALRGVADEVGGALPLDYWKSVPYFVNFMDGYQLADKVRHALRSPEPAARLAPLLRRAQRLDAAAVGQYKRIDPGNARLRRLAADTVDADWWKLLWLPPSLPYTSPGGPYAEPFAADITKRLVFSSWSATPTAVAALLSYEAERSLAAGNGLTKNSTETRRNLTGRLAYRSDGGRAAAMTTLALFWPTPGLARLGDPLAWARRNQRPRPRHFTRCPHPTPLARRRHGRPLGPEQRRERRDRRADGGDPDAGRQREEVLYRRHPRHEGVERAGAQSVDQRPGDQPARGGQRSDQLRTRRRRGAGPGRRPARRAGHAGRTQPGRHRRRPRRRRLRRLRQVQRDPRRHRRLPGRRDRHPTLGAGALDREQARHRAAPGLRGQPGPVQPHHRHRRQPARQHRREPRHRHDVRTRRRRDRHQRRPVDPGLPRQRRRVLQQHHRHHQPIPSGARTVTRRPTPRPGTRARRLSQLVLLGVAVALLGCTGHSSPPKETVNPNNAAESDAIKHRLADLPGVVRVDGGYARNASEPGGVNLGITVRRGTSLQPLMDAALREVWLSKLSPCSSAIITVGTEDDPPTSITHDYSFPLQRDDLTQRYGPRPVS